MHDPSAAAAAGGDVLVSIRHLDKYYGGLRALNDVSLDVRRGEILALVGDNGAGKSTLIKTLSGAVEADGGEMVVDGRTVDFKAPGDANAAGIETVHQSLGLVDALDVPQNVFLGRELTKKAFGVLPQLDQAAMRSRTRELLERFGIDLPTLHEPVRTLSGGQRQTIAISRLLLAEPKLLIMDEPMAALGVDEGSKVLDLLVRLRASGLTILVISHNLEHVFAIADRIAVMKNGKLIGVVPTAATTREAIVGMITIGAEAVAREGQPWLQ